MFSALNITPLLFTIFTGFGVVVHDTQIDHAAVTAITSVGAVVVAAHSTLNVLPDLRPTDQHTHAESVKVTQTLRTLNGLEPRLQTRFNEEKKYIGPKKLIFNTSTA